MRCFWCVQQSEVWSIKINALHSEIFHLNRHERHISSPTVQSCIKMLPVLSSCRLKYPIKCCKPLCCFSSFLLFHNTLNQYLFQLNVPRKKKICIKSLFFPFNESKYLKPLSPRTTFKFVFETNVLRQHYLLEQILLKLKVKSASLCFLLYFSTVWFSPCPRCTYNLELSTPSHLLNADTKHIIHLSYTYTYCTPFIYIHL